MSKKSSPKVEFKYTKADIHQKVFSNRIGGGLRDGGLFELNFFLETPPMPKKVVKFLDSEKEWERVEDSSKEFIRENQVTVYVPISSLLSFRDWIDKRVADLEKKGFITKIKD